MAGAVLDSTDVAIRLGTTRFRVTELLAKNPGRYSAWKEKGTGRQPPPWRWRWRVPAESVGLLAADMGKG